MQLSCTCIGENGTKHYYSIFGTPGRFVGRPSVVKALNLKVGVQGSGCSCFLLATMVNACKLKGGVQGSGCSCFLLDTMVNVLKIKGGGVGGGWAYGLIFNIFYMTGMRVKASVLKPVGGGASQGTVVVIVVGYGCCSHKNGVEAHKKIWILSSRVTCMKLTWK